MYGYFNPRSHEGSDLVGSGPWRYPPDFNPRSHEGSDDGVKNWEQNLTISIHAPTRGATFRILVPNLCKRFQSTLPRGERLLDTILAHLTKIISIHAPTRGATETAEKIYKKYGDFNPRSHEGSDDTPLHQKLSPCQFQSTLPRGERLLCVDI